MKCIWPLYYGKMVASNAAITLILGLSEMFKGYQVKVGYIRSPLTSCFQYHISSKTTVAKTLRFLWDLQVNWKYIPEPIVHTHCMYAINRKLQRQHFLIGFQNIWGQAFKSGQMVLLIEWNRFFVGTLEIGSEPPWSIAYAALTLESFSDSMF